MCIRDSQAAAAYHTLSHNQSAIAHIIHEILPVI